MWCSIPPSHAQGNGRCAAYGDKSKWSVSPSEVPIGGLPNKPTTPDTFNAVGPGPKDATKQGAPATGFVVVVVVVVTVVVVVLTVVVVMLLLFIMDVVVVLVTFSLRTNPHSNTNCNTLCPTMCHRGGSITKNKKNWHVTKFDWT
jgi:hypothetical protein